MNILEKRVKQYFDLKEKLDEIKEDLEPLSEWIKSSVPEGLTRVGNYTIIKTHVLAVRVESFDRSAHDKLEVRKNS